MRSTAGPRARTLVGGQPWPPQARRIQNPPPRPAPTARRYEARSLDLDEAPNERERRVGDLAPAAVDRERVPAVLDLDDLGHALVVLLLLVRGVRDRPRDRVVLLAGDDQER